MDISAVDIGAIFTAIGSGIAAIKGTRKANAVQAEADSIKVSRMETKLMRDKEFHELKERVCVLEQACSYYKEKLDDSRGELQSKLDDNRSDIRRLESSLEGVIERQDKTNEILNVLVGEFKALTRFPQHTPELRPL